ncbi:hypothetical protein Syncc8109_1111 [Synechococcus sp. WH 8109]|nr:hypothetical protein Syncc8109_1111 [Synechococcus sp. WH 8109]
MDQALATEARSRPSSPNWITPQESAEGIDQAVEQRHHRQ